MKKKEGDPEIKQKRKKIQKELLEKSASLSQVKNADIVITNPTHIAVALKYDPDVMVSPKVVALGKGTFAQKIKSLAYKFNVAVYQNKPLARKLFKETQLEGFVPVSCYAELVPLFREILKTKQTRNAH